MGLEVSGVVVAEVSSVLGALTSSMEIGDDGSRSVLVVVDDVILSGAR